MKTENCKLIIHQRAFSLVETLLVLSIIAIVAVVGVTSFSNFNTEKALSLEAEKVVSLLVQARSLTLSAKEGAVFGVHFEQQSVTLYKGTYSAGGIGNRVQPVNEAVRISSISLYGGGADVTFKKLTGATQQNGTITIASTKNALQTRVVTITSTGTAYSN